MNQNTQLSELPAYWQGKIRDLRAENAKMRCQRNEAFAELESIRSVRPPLDELPVSWQKTLRKLYASNQKAREQRNEARAEAEALRAELEAR